MEILERVAAELMAGEDERTATAVAAAIAAGTPPGRILDEGLIAGMNAIGQRFRAHEIFLPDVLLAARAMYAGLGLLKPLLEQAGVPGRGKVVIGTVQGDLHDIGKNLVGIMLRGAGYEVIDLGSDVAPERFVATAKAEGAGLIGMSALLTTTMPVMGRVVELLRAEGLSGKIKVVVGGAPLSAAFAAEIGADAYAFDGANAVQTVEALLRGAGAGQR
ncbi:cobalamin-binding protein [bacterium]|nr:cobalamin-binding protein [bacterium]